MGGFILLVLCIALYFVPAIVAHQSGHRQTAAITMLNICAGWTLIGWVVALVWACTVPPRDEGGER